MGNKIRQIFPFLEIQEIYRKVQNKEIELGKKYQDWESVDKILFLYEEKLIELPILDNIEPTISQKNQDTKILIIKTI